MKLQTMFLTFAWISLIGLAMTILTDFLIPILISVAVFFILILLLVQRRN